MATYGQILMSRIQPAHNLDESIPQKVVQACWPLVRTDCDHVHAMKTIMSLADKSTYVLLGSRKVLVTSTILWIYT